MNRGQGSDYAGRGRSPHSRGGFGMSNRGRGRVQKAWSDLPRTPEHTVSLVRIIKICRDLGIGPGGFYQPGYRDGAKLRLKMMCLGKNWDPETNEYGENRSSDDSKPPMIPEELNQFVGKAIKDAQVLIEKTTKGCRVEDILPLMLPDICIVNFYSSTGRLGLHQDRDESQESLHKGLPVVSFSFGDSAEFLYGDQRDPEKAEKVTLESGDVLIFGGRSRHIFH